ncbi:MAG TPA: glycosyltransferase [Candidatus Binatia bacterium]
MIALLFGTYNSRHAANSLLASDLRAAGFEVRECHEPLWEATRDKDAPYFAPLGLARLALRYLAAAARLARRFPASARGASLVVAGFNGQLDVLLARALAGGRRVLFAPLVTVSETLIDDRATYRDGTLAGRLLRALDRRTLAAADVVLIDTAAHRDYLIARLGAEPARVVVQYLGAEPAFAAAEAAGDAAGEADVANATDVASAARPLRVLGYSQYLPLHGNEVIAQAARLLTDDPSIAFELVGTGPERARVEPLLRALPNVTLVDWVPYEELPARIAAADVALGVFGTTDKARMVIPNKVYQAAQVGRAIVTADTPAIREVFVHGESAWLVPPEPRALADALLRLARDPDLRARLGRGARSAVERAAGPAVRAERLRAALAQRGLVAAAAPLVEGVAS